MRFSARVFSRRRADDRVARLKEATRTISQLDFGRGAQRIRIRLSALGHEAEKGLRTCVLAITQRDKIY